MSTHIKIFQLVSQSVREGGREGGKRSNVVVVVKVINYWYFTPRVIPSSFVADPPFFSQSILIDVRSILELGGAASEIIVLGHKFDTPSCLNGR